MSEAVQDGQRVEEITTQDEVANGSVRKASFLERLNAKSQKLQTTRSLCIMIFLFTVLVMIAYKPLKHAVEGDTAIYDYIAQCILRGQLPYRDIADIKFPGSVYINAFAMWLGSFFGLRDVYALRIMQIIEFGIYNILAFLIALHYFRSRIVGLIAVMIPLMNLFWINATAEGTQPKLPMMMFGALSLWLIAKDRPFWAGFAGMLSCICWQPGLLFVGTAGLVCSNYLRNWRDLRAVKVVAGASIPLLVLFGYFYFKGAFGDFWAWTMEYNYGVFGPDARRPLPQSWLHMRRVFSRFFLQDIFLVLLGVAGFLVFVAERIRARWKGLEKTYADGQFKDALIFPVIVYFMFTLINMQGRPDLIPYMLFVSLFAGYFFANVGRLLGELFKRPEIRWTAWAGGVALVALTLIVVVRAATHKFRGYTFKQQNMNLQPYRDMLQEGDKIYVHGMVEMLVLFKLQNLNPYIFLNWGADEFAAYKRGMTFEQIVEEMEAQKPKLVFLSRLNMVSKADVFRKWVGEHYTETAGNTGIFIRKE